MTGLKFISMIFPFIRELILGEKTLAQAVKTNKFKVLLIVLIMGSFALNFWITPKVISITDRYVTLRDRYVNLEQENKNLRDNQAKYGRPVVPPVKIEPKPEKPPTDDWTEPAPTPVPDVPTTTDPQPVESTKKDRRDIHGYNIVKRSYDRSVRRSHQQPKAPPPVSNQPTPATPEAIWQKNFDRIQDQEDTMYHRNPNHSTQR